jgi:hypothetical protein
VGDGDGVRGRGVKVDVVQGVAADAHEAQAGCGLEHLREDEIGLDNERIEGLPGQTGTQQFGVLQRVRFEPRLVDSVNARPQALELAPGEGGEDQRAQGSAPWRDIAATIADAQD